MANKAFRAETGTVRELVILSDFDAVKQLSTAIGECSAECLLSTALKTVPFVHVLAIHDGRIEEVDSLFGCRFKQRYGFRQITSSPSASAQLPSAERDG